nr:uncharacterized protein LOC131752786 [Kogia breviceps]
MGARRAGAPAFALAPWGGLATSAEGTCSRSWCPVPPAAVGAALSAARPAPLRPLRLRRPPPTPPIPPQRAGSLILKPQVDPFLSPIGSPHLQPLARGTCPFPARVQHRPSGRGCGLIGRLRKDGWILKEWSPAWASGSPREWPVRPVECQGNDLVLPVELKVAQSQFEDFPSLLLWIVLMPSIIRGKEKAAICKQGRELSTEPEPCWNLDCGLSGLQNCEKMNFCCLSHAVCGILLQQPE